MSFTLRRLTTLQSHLSLSPQTLSTASARPLTLHANANANGRSFKLGSSLSSSASASPAMSAQIKSLVDKTIAENKVVVFSKSYCPYCTKAKKYLAEDTDDIAILELDQRDDGSEIQAYLKTLNGQGTVPHVYINKEFIGGSSDLVAIPHQQIKARIAKAA